VRRCRSSVFSPAAERRKFIAWRRQPQDVPKRPQPFPVPRSDQGVGVPATARLSPRRGWKRLLLTCLRVLGLTPSGYELSLRSLRNCRARPGPGRAKYKGKPLQRAANTSCPRSGRFVCLNSAFSRQFTVHLFRPWIPNSAPGKGGGPRRFTAIVLNVSRRRFGGPAGVEPQIAR